MTKISCFYALLVGKKKKSKVADDKKGSYNDSPKVKPVNFIDTVAGADVGECGGDIAAPCDLKVVNDKVAESVSGCGDDKASMKRDLSDFDLHARDDSIGSNGDGAERYVSGATPDAVIAPGRESDVAEAVSPKLKRSCSNIETKRSGMPEAADLPTRSRSYGDLRKLPGGFFGDAGTPRGAPDASPAQSVRTSCTADRVMLKKRSSSQVLPSRSRKLWWRLFLWSHRNLHRERPARPTASSGASNRHAGYSSDTLEAGPAVPDRKNKKVIVDEAPAIPNQWVAFSAENSLLDRVSAWVNSLGNAPFPIEEDDDDGTDQVDCPARPHFLEVGESSGKCHSQAKRHAAAADEVMQANSIIQSLNAFSSVAHISGMGLKVVPMIAPFSSLRAVNLSSNFIVHISPGSLPKGLHSLNLSRNKIGNIEGLRELTRLRVLNLSYNRISRIGHGLSNCTAIKELYLAGNKISDVEGLHRLLKLNVLDLSFNKITTAKALGQLVANYHSLLALNLLGNPVQANIGDDALRKAVTGLLPQLAYLNKQPVKAQRAREVATDSVARAALGNTGRSPRRRSSRRLSQSPGSATRGRSGEGGSLRGSRSKSKHQS